MQLDDFSGIGRTRGNVCCWYPSGSKEVTKLYVREEEFL